ncbi:MAG: hypothetical protein ACRDTT_12535 [Pseudonocardiaceae bacterium]
MSTTGRAPSGFVSAVASPCTDVWHGAAPVILGDRIRAALHTKPNTHTELEGHLT